MARAELASQTLLEWLCAPRCFARSVSAERVYGACCSVEASRVIAEEAELFKITVSFGSCSSLISLPCYMSHASIPAALRAARGLPDDLLRISVGIEDPSDLLAGEHAFFLYFF